MRALPSLRLLLLSVVAAVLVLSTSGCADGQASDGSDSDDTTQRPAARVEVLRLQPTGFEDVIELTGSVEALNDAELSAQASGTITQLADRGDVVPAGGTVAQIDPREEQAAVDQLHAQFNLAEDRLQRQRPLYQDSIISAQEFEQIRSEYARLKAALAEAEQRLSKTRIATPFRGSVEERFVEAGEQVSPGTPVARVVNTDRVRVTAGVPERYANDIVRGTSVRLDFRRYGGTVRTSQVAFAGNAINPDTRTFPVEVELNNPDGRLKPEMVARLLVTRVQLDSALVIPRTAVVRDEMGTHAYVAADADSTLIGEKRSIVLGPSYGERSVVLSGLAPGERIIVAGQNNLAPGDPVRIATEYDNLKPAGTPIEGPSTEGLAVPDTVAAQ